MPLFPGVVHHFGRVHIETEHIGIDLRDDAAVPCQLDFPGVVALPDLGLNRVHRLLRCHPAQMDAVHIDARAEQAVIGLNFLGNRLVVKIVLCGEVAARSECSQDQQH